MRWLGKPWYRNVLAGQIRRPEARILLGGHPDIGVAALEFGRDDAGAGYLGPRIILALQVADGLGPEETVVVHPRQFSVA